MIVSQTDINNSSTNRVYITYYNCQVTETEIFSYAFAGTYFDAFCIDNCTPIIISLDEAGLIPASSSYLTFAQDCTPIVYTCDTCYDLTVIEPGYTTFSPFINMDSNMGNVDITLSLTGGNDINQFFIGNTQSTFGSIFDFESTGGTIVRKVGFWSFIDNGLDLGIYTQSDGTTPFEPFTFNICVSCIDYIPCTGDTADLTYNCYPYTFVSLEEQTIYWTNCDGTQTVQSVNDGDVVNITCARECTLVGNGSLTTGPLCGGFKEGVEGVTLNITQIGWLKYTNIFDEQIYEYVSSLGTYIINGCLYCDSVIAGVPNAQVANWNSKICGPECFPSAEYVQSNINVVPQESPILACQQTSPNSIYTSYIYKELEVGLVFFSDQYLEIPFDGDGKWFRLIWKGETNTNEIYAVRLNASGVLQQFETCSSIIPTPTVTPTVTVTPSVTPTITSNATPTPTPSITSSNTPTPSITPTNTKTPTNTPSNTPTITPTQTNIKFPNADYIVFQYTLAGGAGVDLDTLTTLVAPTTVGPLGYCTIRNSQTSGVYGGPYLYWGGDNTNSAGVETDYVDVKALKLAFPSVEEVALTCRANWYSTRGNGNVFITMFAYSGGTMVGNGNYGFTNIGGVLLGQQNFPTVNVTTINSTCTATDCIGTYTYTISTGQFLKFECLGVTPTPTITNTKSPTPTITPTKTPTQTPTPTRTPSPTPPELFYIRGINCSNPSDVRFFSYRGTILNDGDVIQISGINTGCWTLSTTSPGTGQNGEITDQFTIIGDCINCTI